MYEVSMMRGAQTQTLRIYVQIAPEAVPSPGDPADPYSLVGTTENRQRRTG